MRGLMVSISDLSFSIHKAITPPSTMLLKPDRGGRGIRLAQVRGRLPSTIFFNLFRSSRGIRGIRSV